jgi:hypothetical protein
MQFRVRTLLSITTGVAVYLGLISMLNQVFVGTQNLPSGPLLARSLPKLPLFIVWLIGVIWVYEHRSRLRSSELVLTGLGLMMAWNMASDPLSMAVLMHMNQGRGTPSHFLLMAISLFSFVVNAGGWALILVAYARANERRTDSGSVTDEAEAEISGPLTLLRE